MRIIFRICSFLLLVAAVFVGVFDCVQSFSAGSSILTPLRITWAMVNERSAAAVENFLLASAQPLNWQAAVDWIFGQPAVGVLLALSLCCWIAGYKRPHLAGRFAA